MTGWRVVYGSIFMGPETFRRVPGGCVLGGWVTKINADGVIERTHHDHVFVEYPAR